MTTAPKFQNKYRIPSARATWHKYDSGMYFVTICTKEKTHYFGEISDGEMRMNELGRECVRQIKITSKIRSDMNVSIPVYTVMPNHIHLIVCIDAPCRDAMPRVSNAEGDAMHCVSNAKGDAKHCVSTETGNRFQPQSKNLASVIRGLKSAVTIFARKYQIPFAWQTRFHDRIIRDQNECNTIADYIENNVMNWHLDELNLQ